MKLRRKLSYSTQRTVQWGTKTLGHCAAVAHPAADLFLGPYRRRSLHIVSFVA
jgi:hypothetical protein